MKNSQMKDQEKLLNKTFGEHCGLNADWSVMAWLVIMNNSLGYGLFIVDNEDTGKYEITQRSYSKEDYNTVREFTIFFRGTAEECVKTITQYYKP